MWMWERGCSNINNRKYLFYSSAIFVSDKWHFNSAVCPSLEVINSTIVTRRLDTWHHASLLFVYKWWKMLSKQPEASQQLIFISYYLSHTDLCVWHTLLMKALSAANTCLRAASDWPTLRKVRYTSNTFFINGLWPSLSSSWVWHTHIQEDTALNYMIP